MTTYTVEVSSYGTYTYRAGVVGKFDQILAYDAFEDFWYIPYPNERKFTDISEIFKMNEEELFQFSLVWEHKIPMEVVIALNPIIMNLVLNCETPRNMKITFEV